MKANELMVGDIFMVNKDVSFKNGTIVMVHGIDADRRFHELKGCATCVAIDDQDEMQGGVWLDYLDPIPLTPEILEKNGFKKCAGNERSVFKYEDDDYTKKALYQVLWSANELYLEIAPYTSKTGEFNRFGVEFVHQLQHALRLCGIEKDIEL